MYDDVGEPILSLVLDGLLLVLAGQAALETHRWVSWDRSPTVKHAPARPGPVIQAPRVSFLVPAWNAVGDVTDFVDGFRALSWPDKELILCCGGEDGTADVARRLEGPDVTVLLQGREEGKQGALAKCWAVSTGQLIYLTDIDCRPTDLVVTRLLAPLADGSADVTTGGTRALDADLHDAFVRCRAAIDACEVVSEGTACLGLNGRNAALVRGVLEAVQGFSAPAPSGTDYTLAQEIRQRGYVIRYVSEALMPTRYAKRVRDYVRQQRRWFRNVFRLGRRYHVAPDVRRTALTLALTYLAVGGCLVGLIWEHWMLVPIVLVAVHVTITRLGYQKRASVGLHLSGTWIHMGADLIAVLAASLDIVSGADAW